MVYLLEKDLLLAERSLELRALGLQIAGPELDLGLQVLVEVAVPHDYRQDRREPVEGREETVHVGSIEEIEEDDDPRPRGGVAEGEDYGIADAELPEQPTYPLGAARYHERACRELVTEVDDPLE